MEPQVLSLDCEALKGFRYMFDAMLRNMVSRMEKKGLSTGTLTGKIKISTEAVADQDGEIRTMVEIRPDVNMKIDENEKAEMDKVKGIFLKFDVQGNPVIGTEQVTMEEIIRKGA